MGYSGQSGDGLFRAVRGRAIPGSPGTGYSGRRRRDGRSFGRRPGAAAIAVAEMAARLAEVGGLLIDAQQDSPFLRSLGAEPVPRERT